MREPKVFCIGFHKTGTSSLANALYILGYRLTGAPLDGFDYDTIKGVEPDVARSLIWAHMPSVVERNDAFQDTPWYMFFRELDERFPGSKFIMTTRATNSWCRSVVTHFGSKAVPDHQWIYGVKHAIGNESVYRRVFEKHYEDVRKYFAGRSEDMLEMDITAGDGWEKLCPFLNVDVPHVSFPKQNVAAKKNQGLPYRAARRLRNEAKRLLGLDDDFLACVRVWRCCYDALDNLEHALRNLPPGADAASQILVDLCAEVLDRASVIKRFLGLEVAGPRKFEAHTLEQAMRDWSFVATDLRHLAGAIVAENISPIVPETGESVSQSIRSVCGRVDAVAARLRVDATAEA